MKKVILAISALLLIGVLTNQSLWLDEATSVLAARDMTVTQIVEKFSLGDFHPSLYYVILHFWLKIGSSSEIWARLPSVFATLLTVFLVYKIARLFMGNKWSLVAALLFGTNPLVFYYSHEARMYSLATLFVTASFWAFFNWLAAPHKKWLIAWVVFSTLLVYTDYMPFLVLPVFLVPFFVKGNKTSKSGIIIWLASLVIFFLPWVPTFLHQFTLGANVQSSAPGWSAILGSFSLKSLPLLWVKILIGRVSFLNKFLYGLFVLLISGLYVYVLSKCTKGQTKNRNLVAYLFAWVILPVFLGLIISLRVSVFQYFRFLFIIPAFYLLVSLGARRFRPWVSFAILAFNLFFIGYYLLTPRFYREDWRSAAAYIKTNQSRSSVVLFPNPAQSDPYRYYGSPSPVVSPDRWSESKPAQVWLFRYVQEVFDPQDLLRKQLETSGYSKIEEVSFNQVLVWRYEKL